MTPRARSATRSLGALGGCGGIGGGGGVVGGDGHARSPSPDTFPRGWPLGGEVDDGGGPGSPLSISPPAPGRAELSRAGSKLASSGAMSALAWALRCSGDFWRRVSGPQEQRLLEGMSYGMVASMALAMLASRYLKIPYGRYASSTFGPPIPAKVAWALQEAPAFLVPLGLVLGSDGARLSFWPNRFLLALFLIHYAYRAFIFPFLIRGGKPTPAITFLLAFVFCMYNGYLQGRSLSNYAEFSSDWPTTLRFILGFSGWLSGLLINVQSDNILRNLRKPGETGYKIPRGGMFEYVSGANYFGEILEWCGFALASCTLESTAFAVCTFLILGRRAYMHHHWYLDKFEDYPRSRKILIPFIF